MDFRFADEYSAGGSSRRMNGPTAAQRRQIAAEQRAKKIRHARYMRIIEESAAKRKLQEMENIRMDYQESVKALPLSSTYQKRIRQAMAIVPQGMIED